MHLKTDVGTWQWDEEVSSLGTDIVQPNAKNVHLNQFQID